jgi:hypothetical protein
VYTFRDAPDWVPIHTLLADTLSRDLMTRLFERLPADVQSYFRELAGRCRGNVGVCWFSVKWTNRGWELR